MIEEEERNLFRTTYKNNDREPRASCQSVLPILLVVSQVAVYRTYATKLQSSTILVPFFVKERESSELLL